MGVPGNANALLLVQAAAAGGYTIERSLRFSAPDSAYLSRTPASAGNRKTWTWAGWVKRSALSGSRQGIFACANGAGTVFTEIEFDASERIIIYDSATSGQIARLTTAVFRDVASWYHIVLSVDTTNATADNRVRLYVNGSEITVFTTKVNPTQNADTYVNAAVAHSIGSVQPAAGLYLDGYLADVIFVDGQALDPTSFGEFDTNGVWQPIEYAGSYGTNGFHLDFSDNSSAAALGYDAAGSNDWTVNNLSATAGAGNDSLVDTPTSYGTDAQNGGEVRGNYCTWNPLQLGPSTTLANGNLDVTTGTTTFGQARGTIAVSSGKYYWEITVNTGMAGDGIGIISPYQFTVSDNPGYYSNGYAYNANGQKYSNASATSYGASYTTGDVIGVALDLDAGTLVFYKNGSSQGTAFSSLSGTFVAAVGDSSSGAGLNMTANFGQRAFAYTAPSGFKALCDTNLTAPVVAKSSDYFQTVLWTGDGASTRSITGLGFSPDFVWIKNRNQAGVYHNLFDVIRGTGKTLYSNTTDSEATNNGYGYLSSFDSNGFSLSAGGAGSDNVNVNSWTYAAWTWDAGSSTVTNTQGSITSSVRANASSGFSVVTFTSPTGTGNFSVGHGLGVTPEFVIVKSRDAAGVWYVYHKSLATDYYLRLNGTNAAATDGVQWGAGMTSSVLGLRASYSTVSGATSVAYAWAPVSGYSSFGSYVGNGSADGPFVYTGFRPRYVLQKKTSDVSAWAIRDAARDPYNAATTRLWTNFSSAESSADAIDLLSNGFKVRNTDTDWNANGATYIYAAFAENPFQYARAR